MVPPPYVDWSDPDVAPNSRTHNRSFNIRNYPEGIYNYSGGAYGRRVMYWGEVFGRMATSQESDDLEDVDSGMSSSHTIDGLEGGATADFRRRYHRNDAHGMEDVAAFLFPADESESSSEDSDDAHSFMGELEDITDHSGAQRFDATAVTERHENPEGMSWESESSASPQISAVSSRLLLSSARQNPTNENTFVRMRLRENDFPHALSRNSVYDAVPLRRQNAICRHVSPPPAPTETKVTYLRKTVKGMIKGIKESIPSFGKSPLFSDSHIWDKKSLPFLSPYCPHNDDYSMEAELNTMLYRRKTSQTFSVTHETVSTVKDRKENKVHAKHKRRGEFTSSSRKRRKAGNTEHQSPPVSPSLLFGDSIGTEHLSNRNKETILDGPASSILKSGSIFTARDDDIPSSLDSLEIVFAEVSYPNSNLEGFFRVETKELSQFRKFIVTLAGDLRSIDGRSVGESLDEMLVAYEASGESCIPRRRKKLPNIPFVGSLVDFKKKDLRFLEDPHHHVETSNWASNDRVGSQLAEWLKISPFSQISETFFLKQIQFASKCLTKFPEIPQMNQKSILNFCERLVNESWLLTRYSESIACASIPEIQNSYQRMKRKSPLEREEVRLHLKEPPFTREWNRSLCRNLTRFLCCPDPCLLNLQLNYILFTIEVDVYAVVKSILDAFSNIPNMNHMKVSDLRRSQAGSRSESSRDNAIFIGSIHRKTGELNLSKVRSCSGPRGPLCDHRFSEALYESGPATDVPQSRRVPRTDEPPHQHQIPPSSNTPVKRATGVMHGWPKRG